MNSTEKNALSELRAEVSALRDALLGTKLQPNGLLKKVNALTRRVRRMEWLLIGVSAALLAGERAWDVILKFLL